MIQIDDLPSFFSAYGSDSTIFNYMSWQDISDMPIKLYSSQVSNFNANAITKYRFSGAGTRPKLNESLIVGLAEALERYSLGVPCGPRNVLRLRVGDQSQNKIGLDDLQQIQGFSEEQFRNPKFNYQKISDDTAFEWMDGHRLLSREKVLVPVEAVLVSHGNRYFEVSTNGCAIGTSLDMAFLSAVSELVERDSFVFHWFRKEPFDFINFIPQFGKFFPDLAWAFGPWINRLRLGIHKHFLGITVIFAFFIGEKKSNEPNFLMSLGADLDPMVAVRKSLMEIGASMNHHLGYPSRKIKKFTANFDDEILTFEDHADLYLMPQSDEFNFFRTLCEAHAPRISLESLNESNKFENDAEKIELLKLMFANNNFDPIVVDQTSSDVNSLGLKVIRVMEPQLIDLDCAHIARRWGKRRLLGGPIQSVSDLNQFPHPFP